MLKEIVRFFANLALKYGTFGIFLGMMAESIGIPGTASVLDLTSGALIRKGSASFIEIVVVSSIGLTAGSLISYLMGYLLGEPLVKRFFNKVGRINSYTKAGEFLRAHGDLAIFLAQFHGTTRTWVSLPAGIFRMDLKKFTLYTFLGGAIYCTLVVTVSYFLYGTIKKIYDQLVHLTHIPFWLGIFSLLLFVAVIIAITKSKRKNT